MQNNAGFFPLTEQNLERFGELMIEDSKQVDILGSWRLEERRLVDANTVKAVQLLLLEPFHTKTPWTRALKEKKVLVVHPFAKQYNNNINKEEHYYSKSRYITQIPIRNISSCSKYWRTKFFQYMV